MHYILYNPLSNKGTTLDDANNIAKKLKKRDIPTTIMNILEIHAIGTFLTSISPDDSIVIVGGDGTINRMCNRIEHLEIKNNVYVSKTGTGNDFYRSIKKEKQNGLIRINDYMYRLPRIEIPEHNINLKYVNGCGIGLDGLICNRVNVADKGNKKSSYFAKTLKAFKEYERIKSIDAEVDGISYNFKDVWLCTVMNSKYQGGGMKMLPQCDRKEDKLYLLVVEKYKRNGMLMRFPLIYLGWHTKLKHITIIEVNKQAIITSSDEVYAQIDGDTFFPVTKIIVKTAAYNETN